MMVFESDKVVLSKNGVFVGKGFATCGIFKLNTINEMSISFAYMSESINLWHGRLEHVNYKKIKRMTELGLITNLGDLSNDKCITCIKCKITCSSFENVERSTNVLDLIHSDMYEMTDTLTKGGKKVFHNLH